MASVQADAAQSPSDKQGPDARAVVLKEAANELVFAVVGHVGSGTSEIALTLKGLLSSPSLFGGTFDVEVLKARSVIEKWATAHNEPLPAGTNDDLKTVERYQDLGDLMRKSGDFAAVAKGLVIQIRSLRASKTGEADPGDKAIPPDGKRRAYILDSVRHPSEVELLRHIYQDAFVLIGVVCQEKQRLQRVMKKYKNAGESEALKFMRRDSKAPQKHGQRVSDAFHLADFFIDNTADRTSNDGKSPNPDWDTNERLGRLIKIVTGSEIVRPFMAETAMHHAYGAAMRSACLSRQVGAALVDVDGNVVATGTNEVPRAGGGVYGEDFEGDVEEHRCAYRKLDPKVAAQPFCSNNQQQNIIIDQLIGEIPQLGNLNPIEKNTLRKDLRDGRVGDLLEFSRAVHAEMDAVFSAARKGVVIVGTRMFVTTFPCHYCARHLVTAGLDEVQFIEPYPKSQALELHSDSITAEPGTWTPPSDGGTKVLFRPFAGVAPRMYRRAFRKDRALKDDVTGVFQMGNPDWGVPWHLRSASYVELEAALVKAG